MARKITAANSHVYLLLLLVVTPLVFYYIASIEATLPNICVDSSDACIAWSINEGYATGICYGDADRTCVCETQCAGEASELPAPMEPTGRDVKTGSAGWTYAGQAFMDRG